MSWGHLIDDRPDEGVFRVHRDAFRDPAVFEQEMARFFERGWVFVGHASQIPHPHDYITVRMGRSPVIIGRDGQGHIHALHNSCRHKGAVVCQHNKGNRRAHLCPYHGWSYASDGRNLLVKDKTEGDYAPSFDHEDHDLMPVIIIFEAHIWLGNSYSFSTDTLLLEDFLIPNICPIDFAI